MKNIFKSLFRMGVSDADLARINMEKTLLSEYKRRPEDFEIFVISRVQHKIQYKIQEIKQNFTVYINEYSPVFKNFTKEINKKEDKEKTDNFNKIIEKLKNND